KVSLSNYSSQSPQTPAQSPGANQALAAGPAGRRMPIPPFECKETRMRCLLCCALIALTCATAPAQSKYQKPPEPIRKVLDAPTAPTASVSPDRSVMLLADGERYPSIADLAQPVLRLAGVRINPRTNGPQRPPRYTAFTLVSIADGKSRKVDLPEKA